MPFAVLPGSLARERVGRKARERERDRERERWGDDHGEDLPALRERECSSALLTVCSPSRPSEWLSEWLDEQLDEQAAAPAMGPMTFYPA